MQSMVHIVLETIVKVRYLHRQSSEIQLELGSCKW